MTASVEEVAVFFFVGGFSNLVAYDAFRRRGESTWSFVRSSRSGSGISTPGTARWWLERPVWNVVPGLTLP